MVVTSTVKGAPNKDPSSARSNCSMSASIMFSFIKEMGTQISRDSFSDNIRKPSRLGYSIVSGRLHSFNYTLAEAIKEYSLRRGGGFNVPQNKGGSIATSFEL